jgi:hypothetical protein
MSLLLSVAGYSFKSYLEEGYRSKRAGGISFNDSVEEHPKKIKNKK